jgi:septal ring factor EnvC (AmiA/AmiB activator)
MSEPSSKFPIAFVFENQEERIQRLENERVEVAMQIAEQTTILKSMKEDIQGLTSSFKESNVALTEFAKNVAEEDSKMKHRISSLEKREKSDVEKTKWYRKLIYAIIVGGGGAVGTLLIEHLSQH